MVVQWGVRYAGKLLIVMGVVHGVVGAILFGEDLLAIISAGPGGGLNWSMAQLAAFWFILFAWLMIVSGVLMDTAYKATGDIPAKRMVGWSFILIPILCGIFLPLSGLWATIIIGFMLVANDG